MRTWFKSLRRGSQIALIVSLLTFTAAAAWGIITAVTASATIAVAPGTTAMTLVTPWNCINNTLPGTCAVTPTGLNVAFAIAGVQDTSYISATAIYENPGTVALCGVTTLPPAQPNLQVEVTGVGTVAPGGRTNALKIHLHFAGATPATTYAPIAVGITWGPCP